MGIMRAEAKIRFETARDYEIVKKAARAEKRSISQFVALAALDRASKTVPVIPVPSRRANDKPEATA